MPGRARVVRGGNKADPAPSTERVGVVLRRTLGRCSAAGLQPTLTLPRVTSMTARPLPRRARAGANHRCHDRCAPLAVLGHGVRHLAPKVEPARGRGQRGDGEDLVRSPALVAVVGDEVGAGPVAGEGGLGIVGAFFLVSASPAADGSSMMPVVTRWSQWCSTPPRCASIPATVQPEATTGVCQASSGSPSTIFSTESRWYCRKRKSMRESSSRFTSLTAGDAVSGAVTESAMVSVFRVGPSGLSTAQTPGTHRGNAAYRLLVRGELLWPGRCDAVRFPATAGRGKNLPGEL